MTAPASDFAGMHVAAFESRRREEMARLIRRYGGVPHVAPSMQEVPLEQNPQAIEAARELVQGKYHLAVFLTGVGVEQFFQQVAGAVDQEQLLQALRGVVLVARGPKPTAALKKRGLTPAVVAPEPNTWRELIEALDAWGPIASKRVLVQEYGASNPQLIQALQARGAEVVPLVVYRWALPEDTGPLAEVIRQIADGQVQVALFTSAQQIAHVVQVARDQGLLDHLNRAMRRVVVGSVGPTTSEALRRAGWPVDVVPEHPHMGHLVRAAAQAATELHARKATLLELLERPVEPQQVQAQLQQHPSWNGPFMRACRREPADVVPVWLMRQAGRYLPEYREIRDKVSFLELCRNPQLCAEVMLRTVEYLGVDAAIIFSDLLPILEPMGLELEFAAGHGPVIHNPVRNPQDVERVLELESVESLHFVMETVRLTRAGLPQQIPVIGFAGAPFTLASYVIEGGASRNWLHTKTLMYRDPGAWHELMGRLGRSVARYLRAQVQAGAQALQVFDSWVGCLGVDDYRQFVLPHMKELFASLPPVPVIHFGTGNPALLPLMAEAGGQVIGLDWRVRLDQAWATVGHDRAVQGNLDPAALLAPLDFLRKQVQTILGYSAGRPGHIFNLGHGVLPQTPPEHARALVQMVHEESSK